MPPPRLSRLLWRVWDWEPCWWPVRIAGYRASIKTYGLLQLVIGFCALLSIPLFRATEPLFSFLFNRFGYDSAGFLLIRFLVVFGFMLVPVTLMGMTLPVVVGASFKNVKGRYAYLAGKLYGVNTLGAVCRHTDGRLFIDPGPWHPKDLHGHRRRGSDHRLRPALANPRGKNAGRLLFLIPSKGATVRSLPASEPSPASHVPFAGTFSWPAAVFLLSGISALAYEIIWFRLLARIIGPSVHAFSSDARHLPFGLALGSLVGAGIVKKIKDHRLTMAVLLGAIGFGPLVTLFFVNKLPIWYGMLFIRFTTTEFTLRNLILQGVMACVLILPATLPLGAFFPVVTRAYNKEQGDDHVNGSVGHLYFYNTIGGVIGSLAAGFWLVPAVGIKSAILVAGGLNIAMAVAIYFAGVQSAWFKKAAYGCVAVTAFSLFAFASPGMNQTILNAGLYSEMIEKENFSRNMIPEDRNLGNLIYFQEGINNSVAVVANKFNDGNLTLHLSGSWEASTEIHARCI